jgi:hypothetical protein
MINLNLTIEEINVALSHMGEGKYKDVAPIISKIHLQAKPQLESQEKPLDGETVES